jgi:hypothetical protein
MWYLHENRTINAYDDAIFASAAEMKAIYTNFKA